MPKYTLKNIDMLDLKVLTEYLRTKGIDYDYLSEMPIENSLILNSQQKVLIRWSLFSGFVCFVFAIYFQYWTESSYQLLNLGGKPFFSLITAIPISLEIGFLGTIIAGIIIFWIRSAANSKDEAEESNNEEILFIVDANTEQKSDLAAFLEGINKKILIEDQ